MLAVCCLRKVLVQLLGYDCQMSCLDQCLILLFFVLVLGTIMSHLSSLRHEHMKVGFCIFSLLLYVGCLMVKVLLSVILLFFIFCICYILVVDPVTGAGFESSGVGYVFVCEQAQDSPAVESEVTSILQKTVGTLRGPSMDAPPSELNRTEPYRN